VCLPNLFKYLSVSSAAFALGDMNKGFITLCNKVDAIAVAGREADAVIVRIFRYCKSLRLRRRVNDI
jgi:hypothetical protein